MTIHSYNQNNYQFDFFSKDYRLFETDFYKYSALRIPLTFLTDDILLTLNRSQSTFFKLNKENAIDQKDHYFYFKLTEHPKHPEVKFYAYQGVDLLTKEKMA
ncbi:DUF5960 family protein [Streptococcus parauberis]|uniref:Uncharacterized protein n=1 Tax=Streptococcus parauberis NCFD 2020 TaxID=873447 RepID=F1YZU5_9STRE|nr:DUF5960 family protein [Streptococcus parauberis]EGE53229.1 hypothetical protein SPB_0545 [Streptococcus parauberis NCFD 2020]RFE02179.1 hypothetical protein ADO06_00443 [Streptococcus parauberis]